MPKDRYKIVRYRPVPLRRRLLIGLLAIVTASTVVWSLTRKSGGPGPPSAASATADVAPCAAGESQGCVGGTAAVIMLPAAPRAASAP
jgi:hypothetical protein